MIITLAEENSHDHKNLDYSIREVIKRAEQVAESVEVGFFFIMVYRLIYKITLRFIKTCIKLLRILKNIFCKKKDRL